MPPKPPADNSDEGPNSKQKPEDRIESAEENTEGETEGEREDEESSTDESILQELAAAASSLVPEAGVAEGPGAGGRRNIIYLVLFIIGIAIAVLIFLYAT